MSAEKTKFEFVVNADPRLIDDTIRRYLAANQFQQQPKGTMNYFFFHDPIIKGKRSFEYMIQGNVVTIYAYLNTFEKPNGLDGMVGAAVKQGYKNDLQPLFEELKRLEAQPANGAVPPQNVGMPSGATSYGNMPPQNAGVDVFVEENNKKKEKGTIIAFVMAIIGLLMSCAGMSYGVILLILEFYLAIQGLQTKKKGLAIATIVIAIISLLFLGFQIVASFLLY